MIPDVKARWDFWIEAWTQGWITTALTSPEFAPALFLVAVVYLFVVQPRAIHIHHKEIQATVTPIATVTAELNPAAWIPLPEAARRIYENNIDNLIGDFARTHKTPQEILEYCAWFAVEKHLPIFGKRPPSNLVESIPEQEIRRCVFQNGAKELRGKSGDSTHWIDLATTQVELDKLLAA
ncbi:MAG: hypothetical protein WCI21_01570 [Alphaproteobacteria bacterium]